MKYIALSVALLMSCAASLNAMDTRLKTKVEYNLLSYQCLKEEADGFADLEKRENALVEMIENLKVKETELEQHQSLTLNQFQNLRIQCQDDLRKLVEGREYAKANASF